MYIKSLTIATPNNAIRTLEFHKGLNLIVDKTPSTAVRDNSTGNNVGKTTVLRLVDFCLGGDASIMYKDPENKKEVNNEVKNFLLDNQVFIVLVLVDNLDRPQRTVTIKRNFLQRKGQIYEINGKLIGKKKEEISNALRSAIFPSSVVEKPTFRQIISHNIRYDENKLSNTLKTLGSYATDEEYETLYLYLLGCKNDNGEEKTELSRKLNRETTYKHRLEKDGTKGYYEAALSVVKDDIQQLEQRKDSLNINPNLERDIQSLNEVKVLLNRLVGEIASLNVRRDIIEEACEDMGKRHFGEDLDELKVIYQQAKAFIPSIQKSFEELVAYHNQMLTNRTRFMVAELPSLNEKIKVLKEKISFFHGKENDLQSKITTSDTFTDLEDIISQLNDLYQRKGQCEASIESINKVDNSIAELHKQLQSIDSDLFSDDFQQRVNGQLAKFNKIFSKYSSKLYEEQYAIKCDVSVNKGKQVYKFAPIDINFSTGKKMGEISCFDLAYTKFADDEQIPCLHFLLNDKKELVHGNQLNEIAHIAETEGIQFVASILEDKLTAEMRTPENYVVELSEEDKLFRF